MVDLLEDYDNLPTEVQDILNSLEDSSSYEDCREAVVKLYKIGYIADFGLDGSLTQLKKYNIKIKKHHFTNDTFFLSVEGEITGEDVYDEDRVHYPNPTRVAQSTTVTINNEVVEAISQHIPQEFQKAGWAITSFSVNHPFDFRGCNSQESRDKKKTREYLSFKKTLPAKKEAKMQNTIGFLNGKISMMVNNYNHSVYIILQKLLVLQSDFDVLVDHKEQLEEKDVLAKEYVATKDSFNSSIEDITTQIKALITKRNDLKSANHVKYVEAMEQTFSNGLAAMPKDITTNLRNFINTKSQPKFNLY